MKSIDDKLKKYTLLLKQRNDGYIKARQDLCNPKVGRVSYCAFYGEQKCPKTCYYAKEMVKKS